MKPEIVFELKNAGWPVLLLDNAARVVKANQAAVKTFGQSVETEGSFLSAIWAAGNGTTAEGFLAQWERSPTQISTIKYQVKGGGLSLLPTSICSFTQDNQKYFILQVLPETHGSLESKPQAAAQAQGHSGDTAIFHKQKLDCALQLARTVSLDFNNALTSILGHTSHVLSQMDANHQWRNPLMEVEKSAARAAEIANDLGAFSRQEKEPRGQTSGNLNSVLQRSVDLFKSGDAKNITWSMQLERKLFSAKFDEAKVQQAFVKIIENAVQSMKTGGRITVQTRNVELTEAAQDRTLRLEPGTYVCAEISDTGCGIEADVLPRIFEPFFTTKRSPQHRGLGLALVYGIVSNHGGGVAVSSKVESGTSVRVYLPAEKKIIRDAVVSSTELKGSQQILMVDDEEILLTMGQTILSAFGYKVLTANNGPKALEILKESKTPIDLLITDMVMPTMGGRELIEKILQLSPRTRILCTSGFVRATPVSDNVGYLQKPFTSQDLLVKVKETLSGSAT